MGKNWDLALLETSDIVQLRGALFAALLVPALCCILLGQSKPKLSIDEFFDSVSFDAVKIAPDGNAVLIGTERPDWDKETFRKELWLYRTGPGAEKLIPLTQSGEDEDPQWSPDGRWIAFLSERKGEGEKHAVAEDDDDSSEKDKTDKQLYLISPDGGEAVAVTSGKETVHAFAWGADSKSLYYATEQPRTKQQIEDHKKEWKDVLQQRGDERGDAVFRIALSAVRLRNTATNSVHTADKDSVGTVGAVLVFRSQLRVTEMSVAGDGKRLAFISSSISERQEKIEDFEIFIASLRDDATEVAPVRITKNEAVEINLHWAPDNQHVFFRVNLGSLEKKYEDPQPRLYWVNADTRAVDRWFATFPGEVTNYSVLQDGSVACACRLGTEVQLYIQASLQGPIVKRQGCAGTYENLDAARSSGKLAFVHSAIERPAEVYIANKIDEVAGASAVSTFNHAFTDRELPNAKPYQWTSDDGTRVEGMLMYPPGKFEAKSLPMFVLIHGGPEDADGNHFEADWYQWDRLAATDGWLVFEPNYRGSTGYGDAFALGIVPQIVSRPGRDILAGVDALIKDGIADPNQLAIGGYSYGGYMTNWLITQTTRFKAAVTGAGAIEHVANWGNDDTTMDDAYFLGGLPWEVPDHYRGESAIYEMNRVRTPTHIVAGADDVRVAVLEDYLLERALHELAVPNELLVFPGEGHGLGKNPWHGKIKVREELKWLDKYGRTATSAQR